MLAFACDGSLAACATCWGIEPASSLEAWINVHPDHRGRGLGTWLVGWAETRARRSLIETGTALLRLQRVSYRVFYAHLSITMREITQSAFFNPLSALEFRPEFDRIGSAAVLELIQNPEL